MEPKELKIVGNNTLIEVAGIKNVPAKVDTGADSSSIWASNFCINDKNELEFCLFAPKSPLYTGEVIKSRDYTVKQVRSSNGQVSIRYQTPLSATILGKKIIVKFTLADRSRNSFPVLIGRRTLRNKFLVDVSQGKVDRPATLDNGTLNNELQKDPQAFHKKYMSK